MSEPSRYGQQSCLQFPNEICFVGKVNCVCADQAPTGVEANSLEGLEGEIKVPLWGGLPLEGSRGSQVPTPGQNVDTSSPTRARPSRQYIDYDNFCRIERNQP